MGVKDDGPFVARVLKVVCSLLSPAIAASLLCAFAGANAAAYASLLRPEHAYRKPILLSGLLGAAGGLAALWLSINPSRHHSESQPLGCLMVLGSAALFLAGFVFKLEGGQAYVTANCMMLFAAGGLAYHSGGGWRGS